MTAHFELPEALRMFQEVMYDFDPRGDPTWPLRQARDVHVKLVRSLHLIYESPFDVAAKVSFCGWFESWTRLYVPEATIGHRLSFVFKLMQTSEKSEVPETPASCKMMKYIHLHNLKTRISLFDESAVHDVLIKNNLDKDWVQLELLTVPPKDSDAKAYISLHFEGSEYILTNKSEFRCISTHSYIFRSNVLEYIYIYIYIYVWC